VEGAPKRCDVKGLDGVCDSQLFTAMEQELGLRLEATRGKVWALVIDLDHAETPTVN
jgi:uncharacterized protein (TIGR03435 family)